MRAAIVLTAALALVTQRALAEDTFVVAPQTVADQKAVFATVESAASCRRAPASAAPWPSSPSRRATSVELGQVVATVGDEKIALQMKSLDAQIAGLEAQLAQAQTDLTRAEDLFGQGTIPRTRLDEARTAFNVADQCACARASPSARSSQQQLAEGSVLAPTAGRVLKVPLTTGTVIMAGRIRSPTIAEQNFVLRLRVPERHARFLKAGDPIRLDADGARQSGPRFGTIRLVYPQIEDGRVVADAGVEGLGDYFVSERIRVWVSARRAHGLHRSGAFITTRFGVDYVSVRADGDAHIDVPVQRGRELPRPDMPDGVEILSGLRAGDRAGAAVNLGLSGRLTQATIRSPLTPLFLLAALAVGLIALLVIPREEEPQISVPMVDITRRADGLQGAGRGRTGDQAARGDRQGDRRRRARLQPDAVDDRVMVTARFLVGTKADDAILRVHEKIRANFDRIPVGIPEPLIVGRGINDVADRGADAVAQAGGGRALDRQGPLPARRQAARRADEGRQCRPELHLRRQPAADPRRARSREARRSTASRCSSSSPRCATPTARSWPARCATPARCARVAAGQTLAGIPDIGLLLVTTRDNRPVYVRDVATVVIGPSPLEHRVWMDARGHGRRLDADPGGEPGARQARRRQRGGGGASELLARLESARRAG